MKVISTILVLATFCISATAQSRPHRATEQSSFGLGEDGPAVKHRVILSDAELAALAKDDLMRQDLDQDPPIPKLTREGIEAAVVHLYSPSERDLVVVGSGPPFIGANVGPFWIIRDLPSGPKVVLSTSSQVLTIQRTRSNGFYNIKAFAATAGKGLTTSFQFNGDRYVAYRQSSSPLGQQSLTRGHFFVNLR